MCSYRVLFQNDAIGYITQCRSCKQYQVAFGTVLLTMTEERFPRFINMVHSVYARQNPSQHTFATKNITIPLPAEGSYLLFSMSELDDLCQMLEQADNEARALAMLELFPASL